MYPSISGDLLPTADPSRLVAARSSINTDAAQLLPAPVTSTFYINRDRDEGRRVFIEWYLREAGIDAERIRAVEGLAVPPALAAYFFDGHKLHSGLKPGEVGVYASHLNAANIVVERGLEHALILEDDAEFPQDFAQSLKNILASVPPGWDMVRLYGAPNRAVKPVASLEQSRMLVRYSRGPAGAVAYLISQAGAKKLLVPLKRYWPVDTDFRQPWRFGLAIYGVHPSIVAHHGRFPSSIDQLGGHSRLRRGLPIPTRYCWTGNPLSTPQGLYFNLKTLGPLWWLKFWLENARRRAVRMLVGQRRERKSFGAIASSYGAPRGGPSPLSSPH